MARSFSRARASCTPSRASRRACTSSAPRLVVGAGLVADQAAERVDPGGQLAQGLGEPEQHVVGALVVQPGSVGGRIRHRTQHRAHGDRRVLQRLEALTQARAHVGGADGADVESPSLSACCEGRADPGDVVVGDPARLVQPGSARPTPRHVPRRHQLVSSSAAPSSSPLIESESSSMAWPASELATLGREGRVAACRRLPHQGLGDPLPGRRLGAERADAEHEHGADRDLDQVGAQAQGLADRDRDEDQQAQAPPVERHGGSEHGSRETRRRPPRSPGRDRWPAARPGSPGRPASRSAGRAAAGCRGRTASPRHSSRPRRW